MGADTAGGHRLRGRARPVLFLTGFALTIAAVLGAASSSPSPPTATASPASVTLFGPVDVAGLALRDDPVYIAPSVLVSARQLSALQTIVGSSDGAMCAAELPDSAAVLADGTPDDVADILDYSNDRPGMLPYSCVVLVGDRLGASSAFIPSAVSDGYARAAQARFPRDPQSALAALAASVREAVVPGEEAVASADASWASGNTSAIAAANARAANEGNQITPGIDGGPLSGADLLVFPILALLLLLFGLMTAIVGRRRPGGPGRPAQPAEAADAPGRSLPSPGAGDGGSATPGSADEQG